MANRLPHVKFNIQTKHFQNNLDRFGRNLGEITEDVGEIAVEKAKELESEHVRSGALLESIRLEEKETKTGKSITLRMGGLASTKNRSGQDYAGYHEFGTVHTPAFRIIGRTMDWIREQGLDEAVELRKSKMQFDSTPSRMPTNWSL